VTTMDCDACKDLLLDLVYDELDEVRAAAVRRHLESCSDCRAGLAQLRSTRRTLAQLPTVDPPPISAALRAALDAATASARTLDPVAAPVAPVAAAPIGPLDGDHIAPVLRLDEAPRRTAVVQEWMRRAGALAMRRQVAMAAVFLLMLGFGVRYLPSQRPTAVATLDAPMPEVIPATELPRETAPAAAPSAIDTRGPRARMQTQPVLAARSTNATAAPAPSGRARSSGPSEIAASNTRGRANTPGSTELDGLAEQPANSADGTALGRIGSAAAPAPVWAAQATGPANNEAESGAANTAQAQGTRAPERTWQSLERDAERHRAEGRTIQAAESLRQALALNPPPEARRSLARALHSDLQRSGQVREAAEVQGQYLTSASDSTGLAANVPSTPHANTATPSSSAPTPSTLRPSMPRPARRSINMQNELSNQYAY